MTWIRPATAIRPVAAMTVSAIALACLTGTPATAEPTTPGDTCSLASSTLTVDAAPATDWNQKFTRYGNTSGEWVGADSTYSVPLKDGRVAWLFSDTLYGDVHDGTLSPTDSAFINNSIVVQKGSRLVDTVTGGTRQKPDALVPQDANGDWHWFGDGVSRPNGDLQIGVLTFHRFGDGYWDWGWDRNSLATVNTRTWKVTSVNPLPSSAGIQWASWYQQVRGATYVYGVEDRGAQKYLHVAKVMGTDLSHTKNWRYWDGHRWVRDEKASARVLEGVGNEYSVTPFRDGYLLITQDTTEAFSNKIVAYTSCSPTGPFANRTEVYRMPEVGALGSYGNPNIFAYNAHEHPEFRSGNTMLISYNVNSFDPDEIYTDVSIYRPRFIDASFTVTPN